MRIVQFEFGPFAENTYLLINEINKTCIVIDPGCYWPQEKENLLNFIAKHELKPVRLLNTHCHIDHIFGNRMFLDRFGLYPEYHSKEEQVLKSAYNRAEFFGLKSVDESPSAQRYLTEKDIIEFAGCSFSILFTPGHSPGSICFYNAADEILIGGDVLFYESIGRTDLPGGNYETLMHSITEKLMPLPPMVTVYSGHGPQTTIGHEAKHNPFIHEYMRTLRS